MSKILKNTTASPINIADTGITLAASPATYTIPPQDYLIWAASSDIVGPVGGSTVVVNDGSTDLSISDGMDLIKGIFPKDGRIVGATDLTKIGNVADRLKVDATFTTSIAGLSWNKKLCYDDMNVLTGGVIRETLVTNLVWVQVYSYTGVGQLSNFQMTLEENKNWQVRLVIDNEELFGSTGISTLDMDTTTLYNLKFDNHDTFGSLLSGIGVGLGKDDKFFWGGPLQKPMVFSTNIKIYVKRLTGQSSKKWRAGIAVISKE